MAIPKKGTRKISVDGKTYRWFAKIDYDYNEKFFIIESVDDNRYQITGCFVYKLNLEISPNIIQQAVRQAKKEDGNQE